jgi:hypothetical protein
VDNDAFPTHQIDLEGTGQTWERAVTDGGPAPDTLALFDDYFDIFVLSCPFVPMRTRDQLTAIRPLADVRIHSTYSYFPGYARDWQGVASGGVTWYEPWLTSKGTWRRLGPDPAEISILMSDLMCEYRGANVSYLNHPGRNSGAVLKVLTPDTFLYSWYYSATYFEAPFSGPVVLPDADGNFLRSDGSAQLYRGSDNAMTIAPAYISSIRGQAGHWVPVN